MELTFFERRLFADLVWFEPSREFLGEEFTGLRPLSLATWKAIEITGLQLFHEDVELSEAEEMREVAAYLWLHTAEISVIKEALWTGSWRAVYDGEREPSAPILALFRAYRGRMMAALAASEFDLRPRPKSKGDDTPKDILGTSSFAFSLSVLLRITGLPLEQLLWHEWLPQLRQMEHAEMRWQGSWTVPKGRSMKDQDYEDTVPDFLKPLTPP